MMTGKQAVAIVDIDTIKDVETGDRKDVVNKGIYGSYTVDLVGVNTQLLGQSQSFTLSYSIIIPRIIYDNEKYVFFNDILFEVKNLSKAKNETEMLLNVQEIVDVDKKNIVKEWVDSVRADTKTV